MMLGWKAILYNVCAGLGRGVTVVSDKRAFCLMTGEVTEYPLHIHNSLVTSD